MTGRLPKIGERIHRTKKGGLESVDWIDNKIVTKVDTADEQVSVRNGQSTISFAHFRDGTVIIIGKIGKQKPISIIAWNIDYYEVYTKKEEKDKIRELINDKNVENDSIRIYPITNIQKVSCKVDIKEID